MSSEIKLPFNHRLGAVRVHANGIVRSPPKYGENRRGPRATFRLVWSENGGKSWQVILVYVGGEVRVAALRDMDLMPRDRVSVRGRLFIGTEGNAIIGATLVTPGRRAERAPIDPTQTLAGWWRGGVG